MRSFQNKFHFLTLRLLFVVMAFILFNSSVDYSLNQSRQNYYPEKQQLGETQIKSFVELFLEVGFNICDASIHQNTENQDQNISKKINFQFKVSKQYDLDVNWELIPKKITYKNINPRLIGLSREINTPPPQC